MLDLLDQIKPTGPNIEQKTVFGNQAFFMNGNMFCGLHGNQMVFRLDEAGRQRFLAENTGSKQFEPFPGKPMKEYVSASEVMLKNSELLEKWVEASTTFAKTLPPKVKK